MLWMFWRRYAEKVDWQYFQERYVGVTADAIVDQRIKMAARYAALEGGLSAGAYSAAIAATLGSLGGASPAAVPAAVATFMVDVAYITRLQLRLAYDIAVLYRVPLVLSDPGDMWKLIRVAFTIKSGEMVREGVTKAVPLMMRPVIKRFYSGWTLLIQHLVRLLWDQHRVVDRQFEGLVDIDPAEVWRRVDAEPGDLSDPLDAANLVAAVDDPIRTRNGNPLRAAGSLSPSLTLRLGAAEVVVS